GRVGAEQLDQLFVLDGRHAGTLSRRVATPNAAHQPRLDAIRLVPRRASGIEVRLGPAEVRRATLSRRSARTGGGPPGGGAPGAGMVGAAFDGGAAVAGAMPWLRLAAVLGVGKHATFGNGRIAVEVLG